MLLVHAARVWLTSVIACVCLLATWVAAVQFVNGRMSHLVHNAIDVSLGFGAAFAATAAVVHVPVFGALSLMLVQRLRPVVAVPVGVGLAPIAYLAVAWQFRESEDSQTVAAWVLYWGAHIPEMVIGALPFAMAGAVLGLLWVRWSGTADQPNR